MTRVASAALRGMLAALLVATPSFLVPTVSADTAQAVALLGIGAFLLITVEYASSYPSLVEFRDAPPFNRIRFFALLMTVLLLSLMARGLSEPSGTTVFVTAMGQVMAQALDFPYGPVSFVTAALPDDALPVHHRLVEAAAGLAFLIALVALTIFYLALKLFDWPRGLGAFNVWINLPTFDPTAGGDVVTRLRRDARINLLLGIVLPFLSPMVARAAAEIFGSSMAGTEQTLIWTVAAWAFLPLSLFMRGIAMARVADMIAEMRRRTTLAAQPPGSAIA